MESDSNGRRVLTALCDFKKDIVIVGDFDRYRPVRSKLMVAYLIAAFGQLQFDVRMMPFEPSLD